MLPSASSTGRRHLNRRLLHTLISSAEVVDDAGVMYRPDDLSWYRTLLGHSFRPEPAAVPMDTTKSALCAVRTWLQVHEEAQVYEARAECPLSTGVFIESFYFCYLAQVMFASALVVFALWWLVRTVLTFFLNLVCPILIVLFAVVCIPQLRAPLLGQNYPLVANLLRNILLKMADSMKT